MPSEHGKHTSRQTTYLQLAIVFTLIFIFLCTMNGYVIFRFWPLFHLPGGIVPYIVTIVMAASFPFLILVIRWRYCHICRLLYIAVAIWLGFVVITIPFLLLRDIIGFVIPVPPVGSTWAVLLLSTSMTLWGLINGSIIRIKTVNIPDFPAKARIVQLTDLHIGTVHNRGYLEPIVEKVNALDPDMIIISGDIVSGTTPLRNGMFDVLGHLNAPTVFIPGNHEHYEGIDRFIEIFRTTGIPVLRNSSRVIKGIRIVGIDYLAEDVSILHSQLQTNTHQPIVLVRHVPAMIDDPRINLILSGHTHGGQIFPFNLLMHTYTPFIKGLYRGKYTKLYISQGSGTWGPPMRVCSSNEITLFHLGK